MSVWRDGIGNIDWGYFKSWRKDILYIYLEEIQPADLSSHKVLIEVTQNCAQKRLGTDRNEFLITFVIIFYFPCSLIHDAYNLVF